MGLIYFSVHFMPRQNHCKRILHGCTSLNLYSVLWSIIMMNTSVGMCNVLVWHLSACLSHRHTHQGAVAMQAAYILARQWGPTYLFVIHRFVIVCMYVCMYLIRQMQTTDNKATTKKRTVAGQQGTACTNTCPILYSVYPIIRWNLA